MGKENESLVSAIIAEFKQMCREAHGNNLLKSPMLIVSALAGTLIGYAMFADEAHVRGELTVTLAALSVLAGICLTTAFVFAVSAYLMLVLCVYLILSERALPGRNRRKKMLREMRNLRAALKDAGPQVSFDHLDSIGNYLRDHVDDSRHPDARFRERFLWMLWARQRRIAGQALDAAWQGSLAEAIAHLRGAYLRVIREFAQDNTPTAWYLLQNPENLATKRLLAEYVTVDGHVAGRETKLAPCVVFSPRWVFELVLVSPRQPGFRYAGTICASECVDVGDADRDVIAKLYEHGGDGPTASLQEVVKISKLI